MKKQTYGSLGKYWAREQREEIYRKKYFNSYYGIDEKIQMKLGGKLKSDDFQVERLISLLITNWDELKKEVLVGNGNYFFRTPVTNPVTNTKEFIEGFVNGTTVVFVGYKIDKYGMDETIIKEVV